MGTTLTGTTPQDTYDSLIKVTDNGPISGTLKALSDGLGNDSTLSLSTTAASIAGTLAVAGDVSIADKIVHIGDTNTAIRFPAADTITFETSGAEVARITSTGNVGIGTSAPASKLHVQSGALQVSGNSIDTVISYSTVGIVGTTTAHDLQIVRNSVEIARVTANGLTFNGDTAAANALDDYEEGTFTVGVSFGGASVGVTTSINAGKYTKIGRQVTVNGYIQLTSKGSSTGDASITGLPFTIPNDFGNYSAVNLWLSAITFANQFQANGVINSTNISLQEITELGIGTSITNADFANNSAIIFSFTYSV
jgi:hypothetical protein